jgi:type II secretion system protein N
MNILKYVGYASFFLASVVFGVYKTFPWDVVKDRAFQMVQKQAGITITADSLEPDWITGVEAEKVQIRFKPNQDPIKLQSLSARAKLFAIAQGKTGLSLEAAVARGTIDADLVLDEDTAVIEADVEKLQLELIPALRAANIPLSGKLSLSSDLTWGIKAPKKTEGKLTLKFENFVVEKGIKVGMFPLPRDFDLGSFELDLPMKEGKVLLKNQQIKGKDVELTIDGTITLMRPIHRSALNLDVGFKPTEALLKADPLIKALLKNLKGKKDNKGFQRMKVTGTFNRMYTRS